MVRTGVSEKIGTCYQGLVPAAAAADTLGANHQPRHLVVTGDPAIKRRIRLAAEVEERAFYAGRAGKEWLKGLAPFGTDPEKPFLEMAPRLIAVFAERAGRDHQG